MSHRETKTRCPGPKGVAVGDTLIPGQGAQPGMLRLNLDNAVGMDLASIDDPGRIDAPLVGGKSSVFDDPRGIIGRVQTQIQAVISSLGTATLTRAGKAPYGRGAPWQFQQQGACHRFACAKRM